MSQCSDARDMLNGMSDEKFHQLVRDKNYKWIGDILGLRPRGKYPSTTERVKLLLSERDPSGRWKKLINPTARQPIIRGNRLVTIEKGEPIPSSKTLRLQYTKWCLEHGIPIACVTCGISQALELHHYKDVWHNLPTDICWACNPCHQILDNERMGHMSLKAVVTEMVDSNRNKYVGTRKGQPCLKGMTIATDIINSRKEYRGKTAEALASQMGKLSGLILGSKKSNNRTGSLVTIAIGQPPIYIGIQSNELDIFVRSLVHASR